jgi:hypothetical protein
MKTTIKIQVVLLVVIALFSSCEEFSNKIEGNGPLVNQTVSLESFNRIKCSLYGNIEITQGDNQEVIITGQSNIINSIKTSIHNKEWDIDLKKGNYSYDELTIKIQIPEIESVILDGSGRVEIFDFVQEDDLSLKIPGSGDISLNQFEGGDKLYVQVDGSGSINCKGEYSGLNELDISIDGSGMFDGFNAETKNCTVDISGSGNCRVNVLKNLKVDISGSGTVTYKGTPSLNLDVNPAGNVFSY